MLKKGNRQLKLKQLSSGAAEPAEPAEKPRVPVLGKLSFLGWARKASSSSLRSPITPTTATTTTTISSLSSAATSVEPDPSSSNNNKSVMPSQPMSRHLITPQVDAPKGASNGTDRRVAVSCRGTKAVIDVKNETSIVDLLVAFCEHESITVNASLLVESYASLGLQRRLRRYERIWNVMNSWDGDSSNSLTIWADALKSVDKDLDLASVANKEPAGFALSLYHSQRPGKWNKRYIMLQPGGQVVSSKHADPGPTDKDVVTLCHLSDYDIYTPTEASTKAQKYPRKYCYAIKSQEKKNIFVNSDNYVHYFSTSDPTTAQRFHAHIHSWRSWYMVHKMLELHKKRKAREAEKPPQILLEDPATYVPKKAESHVPVVNGHKVKVSVNQSKYAIGAFAPLIDTERFNKPLDEFGNDWLRDGRRKSVAQHHDRTQSLGSVGRPTLVGDLNPTDTFAANGLLGDTYAQRKQAQLEGDRQRQTSRESSMTSSFAEGPTLLNGGLKSLTGSTGAPSLEKNTSPQRPAGWFPSALEHSAKQRTEQQRRPSAASSQQEYQDRRGMGSSGGGLQRRLTHRGPPHPQQPLVNLAPKFVEAPQWSREGRGHGVRAPDGQPLVDFATGPNIHPVHSRFGPVAGPPKNLIRRETVSQRGPGPQHRPPPLTRRTTEGNEGRPLMPPPLISPTGVYNSSALPTRRPTVTSNTSGRMRGATLLDTAEAFKPRPRSQCNSNSPSPVSPIAPTAIDPMSGYAAARNFSLKQQSNYPNGNDRDRDGERDRPSTGSSSGGGSPNGGGVYGYSQGPGPANGIGSGGQVQCHQMPAQPRGYSRGQQQQPHQQQQQQAQLPPRYLNSRGEPRTVPGVPPAMVGMGMGMNGGRDARELVGPPAMMQRQQRDCDWEREQWERERGRLEWERQHPQQQQMVSNGPPKPPQPLGQRMPFRTTGSTTENGYVNGNGNGGGHARRGEYE
ncbi:hypothetical protein V8F06_006724 [Rhypophila decipiens]